MLYSLRANEKSDTAQWMQHSSAIVVVVVVTKRRNKTLSWSHRISQSDYPIEIRKKVKMLRMLAAAALFFSFACMRLPFCGNSVTIIPSLRPTIFSMRFI